MSAGNREEQQEQYWDIPGNVSLGYGSTTSGAPTEDTTPAASDPSANTGGGAESRVGSTQSTMSPTHWKDFRRACYTLFIQERERRQEVQRQQGSDGTTRALAALNFTTPSNLDPTFSEKQLDVAKSHYKKWEPSFRSFQQEGKPAFDSVTAMAVLKCKEEPDEEEWLAMYAASASEFGSRRN
ncbi:hypothetical protein B9479_008203 [Cryptococcus floricola]|uniref:Uncharacterized protein n=1 Tax=Cryptococcus floricola TaxID=2591691 RepID=A0A5D3AKQ4_9TREE|nr:hypothetical protein B9479_008203 [Cryptococcus floricola]